MPNRYTSFFQQFDLIGVTPQLHIYNNKRFKSLFSIVTSINILLFSIAFGIYSLVEFLKFENPSVIYSKDNDEKTERIINIKDTLFMFQLVDSKTLKTINNSVGYYKAEYSLIYNNGTKIDIELNIDSCQFGKNVNVKYKDFMRDKATFGKTIEDFYCLSIKNRDVSLFYLPNIGYSSINLYALFKNNSQNYIPENLQTLLVTESDTINHNNKSNPINKNFIYYMTPSYNSLEYMKINYNFQYIKYESDEGLFYKISKYLNGTTFSDMTFYRNYEEDYDIEKDLEESNESKISTIEFGLNRIYFDNYKRSYPRLQSLLAEVMSVVNLLFQIGTQISVILCNKKMTWDMMNYLIYNDKNEKQLLTQQNNNINLSLNNNIKNSERKIIKQESIDKVNNTEFIDKNDSILLDSSKNRISKMGKINKKEDNEIIKNITFFKIIKSFFCFKDKYSKLINFSYNLINEDMNIERILKRLYNLEKIYHNYSKEGNNKLLIFENKRFKEINKLIDKINDDIKKEFLNEKRKKDLKKNKK